MIKPNASRGRIGYIMHGCKITVTDDVSLQLDGNQRVAYWEPMLYSILSVLVIAKILFAESSCGGYSVCCKLLILPSLNLLFIVIVCLFHSFVGGKREGERNCNVSNPHLAVQGYAAPVHFIVYKYAIHSVGGGDKPLVGGGLVYSFHWLSCLSFNFTFFNFTIAFASNRSPWMWLDAWGRVGNLSCYIYIRPLSLSLVWIHLVSK